MTVLNSERTESCQVCDELESRLYLLQGELSDILQVIKQVAAVLDVVGQLCDDQAASAGRILSDHNPRLAWSFAKGLETTSKPLANMLRRLMRRFRTTEKKRKAHLAARLMAAQLANYGYDCFNCNRLHKAIDQTAIRLNKERKTYDHLWQICGDLCERSYEDCRQNCPTLSKSSGVPRPRYVYCRGRQQTPAAILGIFHVTPPC